MITKRKTDGGVPIIAWAEAYLRTKWHLDPASRLATTVMGRKIGGCGPLGRTELGPHLRQCGLGRRKKVTERNKNSSGDEIANVNFYAVRPEATRIR